MKVTKHRCVYKNAKEDVGYAFFIRNEKCYDDFFDWVKSQDDNKLLDNVNEKFIVPQDVIFIRDSDKRAFTFDEDYFNEIFELLD